MLMTIMTRLCLLQSACLHLFRFIRPLLNKMSTVHSILIFFSSNRFDSCLDKFRRGWNSTYCMYASTSITDHTPVFLWTEREKEERAYTVCVVGKLGACWLAPISITNSSPCHFIYSIPLSRNLNERSLIHVSARGAFVASTSDRFLSLLVKAVCTSIPAIPSLHSLVLALASVQGHTTLLWLIKVPTPHFSSFNGVLIPTYIAFCKHCSPMLISLFASYFSLFYLLDSSMGRVKGTGQWRCVSVTKTLKLEGVRNTQPGKCRIIQDTQFYPV